MNLRCAGVNGEVAKGLGKSQLLVTASTGLAELHLWLPAGAPLNRYASDTKQLQRCVHQSAPKERRPVATGASP
jgi:hypothetical protein